MPGAGETIEASQGDVSGVLGVVKSVNIANGTYTAHVTDSVPFVDGPGISGTVTPTTEGEFSLWQQHVNELRNLGYAWDEEFNRFIKVSGAF